MGKISLGKVKGEDGKSVFVKYNTVASDSGASEVYSNGMSYIGIALATGNVAPSSGYKWMKFVGPQGVKGDTGATGPRGPQGEIGQTGPAPDTSNFVTKGSFVLSGTTLTITLS